MTPLLDVNVLVAVAWPNHIHHEAALHWFSDNHRRGWATCPVTESAFVKVSSNARAVPEAKSPAEAIHLLKRLTTLDGHVFWTDDISIARSELVAAERILGYRQVTDAQLVAVALRHRGRLVTFDRGIEHVVPADVDVADLMVVLE